MIRGVTWYVGTERSAALGELFIGDKYVVLADINFLAKQFLWRAYHPVPAALGHGGVVCSSGMAATQVAAAKAINAQFARWGFAPVDLSPFSPPSYEEEEDE